MNWSDQVSVNRFTPTDHSFTSFLISAMINNLRIMVSYYERGVCACVLHKVRIRQMEQWHMPSFRWGRRAWGRPGIGQCSCSSLNLSEVLTPGQRITTAAIETITIKTALQEKGRMTVRERRSRKGESRSGRIKTRKGQKWEVSDGNSDLCQETQHYQYVTHKSSAWIFQFDFMIYKVCTLKTTLFFYI